MPTPRAAIRRGSALVLALVMVVLLVMMGAAYLQMARLDRRAGAAVETRANLDENSILRFLGQILASDVPLSGGASEPESYDFPWSNASSSWDVPDRFAPVVVPGPRPVLTGSNPDPTAREPRASNNLNDATGSRTLAEGGDGDDVYLASTEPDFTNPANPTWPHLSNIMGVWVDLSNVGPGNDNTPGGTRPMPAQYLSTADNNPLSGDTGLSLSGMQAEMLANGTSVNKGSRFADADGDGIADSRWTWAPLPSESGRAFVMAVRIIDNSALIDVNSWTRSGAGAMDGDAAARWLWPGELDLNAALLRVVSESNNGGGGGNAGVVNNIWDYRLNTTGATASKEERYYNWLDAGAVPRSINNAKNVLSWHSLGTLLERHGQAVPVLTPYVPTGGETFTNPNRTYQRFTARQDEVELRWRNGLNRSTDNVSADPPTELEKTDLALFRDAALEPAFDATVFGSGAFATAAQTYFQKEPRQQLTTLSGSADFGKINLNTADLDSVASVFADSVANGSLPKFANDGSWASANDFANQAAAIIADWRDDDPEITRFNGMYGMEYLPFISQVYVEGVYKASILPADVGAGNNGGDLVTWTLQGDGLVIELVNPWPWTIQVLPAELIIDGTSWGDLPTLIGKDTLGANERVALRRVAPNASSAFSTAPAGATDVSPIPGSPPAWLADAGGTDVAVELQINVTNASPVVYQRLLAKSLPATQAADPNKDYMTGTVTTTGPTSFGVYQLNGAGTANGLAVMTLKEDDIAFAPISNTTTPVPASAPLDINPVANAAPVPTLGQWAKGQNSATDGNPLDTRVADAPGVDATGTATIAPGNEQFVVGNADRIYRTGDLLRMVFIGPRDNGTGVDTVADVWAKFAASNGGTYRVADAMIDVGDGAKVATGAGNFAVNHAAYYLGRFTTLTVGSNLVTGRLNLNTATARTIRDALPLGTPTAKTAFANLIVNARTSSTAWLDPAVTNRSTGTTPGLAYVSELAGAIPNRPGTLVTDFNEVDQEIGPAAQGADGFTDDREEQTMLLSYLNQVAATRSDVFTAYILVRAYPADDFSQPPTDEWRLLAVFDRSNIGGDRTMPRIVAVKKFEDP